MSDFTGEASRLMPEVGHGDAADCYAFPMSFAQQRLWFLDEMAPGNPFYNIPLAIPISYRIDPAILERAINEIVRRHESLRTTFRVIDGEPMQVIRDELRIPLARVALDHLHDSARTAAIDNAALSEARQVFDLRSGPLIRAALVTRGRHDHVLLLTIHHIVADGWSVGILLREISALYSAYAAGQGSPLPELALQYADFTVWQRGQLQGERLERLLCHWRNKLEGAPALEMPTDRPRPRTLDYSGASLDVSLDDGLATGARQLAQEENATLFMTLMAVFVSLLSRYSAQDDVVVGTPIANRNQAETEHIIGFFVNSLIVRCDLSGQPSFREVLRRVRHECLDAYAHQDLPFEQIVEDLRPDRDLSRNPLFQVTFQLVNTPTIDNGGPPVGAPAPEVQRGSAVFDIAVTLMDRESGPLRGIIEYSTQLFDEATIARFLAHFRVLLLAVIADPDRQVSQIALITRPERELLTAQSGRPVAAAPTLSDAVRNVVAASPNDVAIVADDDRMTFLELDRAVDSLASQLDALDVGPGDRVAFLIDGSHWLTAAMLAATRVGAAYVPLDRAQPPSRIAAVLNDATPSAIITDAGVCDHLPETSIPLVLTDQLMDVSGPRPDRFDVPGVGSLPAYVLYTSGSTGNPKGVVVPRSALENHMAWFLAEFEIGPDDRVLQRTTPIFDASVWEFWAPIMSGACLVQLDGAAKRDPAEIAAAVRQHQITVLQVVPSLLHSLLDEPDFVTADSLRLVFSGGEPLTAALRDAFASTSDALLVNLYGPTETTIDATFHRCERSNDVGVPIGRPIAGTGVVVLDDAGEPTPIGVPGRLHLSGAGLAQGYFARPRLTAERFVPNGFADLPGDRLYDTGDLARFRTDGQLEYLGRTDRQVKVRGHRVELGEIEQVLEAHPDVRRAAVIAHRDELLAFVVPNDGLSATKGASTAPRVASHDSPQPRVIEPLASMQPRTVLEIGGSAIVDGPELWSAVPGIERHVEIATESDDVGDECFELVVLHSVGGRHTSAAHLAESIESVLARVGPGGHIAIDQVRSLPLLEASHAAAAIAIADDAMSAVDLARHIDDAITTERDLVLDPQFFVDFAATSDVIAGCTVLLDDRRDDPERFCYDVVFRIGPSESEQPTLARLDWNRDRLSALALSSRLAEADAGCVVVCGIPDGDLAGIVLAAGACTDGTQRQSAGELRAMIKREHAGLTRATLHDIAGERGAALALMPAPTTAGPGQFDAVFTRAGTNSLSVNMRSANAETPRCNEPRRGLLASRLLPDLRGDIERTLPDYMSPSRFVVLPELPTRPNGKIDHGALPIPAAKAPSRTATFQAPADALEEQLVVVWREVIGQHEIGVDDDFFVELGGHSLLAARLAARLRSVLEIDVPLQLVFESPTVASMAAALRHDGPTRPRSSVGAPVGQPVVADREAWTADERDVLSPSGGEVSHARG